MFPLTDCCGTGHSRDQVDRHLARFSPPAPRAALRDPSLFAHHRPRENPPERADRRGFSAIRRDHLVDNLNMDGLPIQPLAAAVAATPHVQVQQSAQSAAQIRREQNRLKVSSIDRDTLERQVESTDVVDPIHDPPGDASSGQPHQHKSRHGHSDAESPAETESEAGDHTRNGRDTPPETHIDLTA